MPTYDYVCKACGHAFEEFQSMSAKVLKKCPKCGKPALERLIGTGAAIVFKGSGFYQTDYRSESYRKAAEADKSPATAPAATTADGATSTKPSEKTDAKTPVDPSKASDAGSNTQDKSKAQQAPLERSASRSSARASSSVSKPAKKQSPKRKSSKSR